MTKTPHPTKAELEILNVLWARGPLSVRDVQRALSERREVGYTSALKTMQIMTQKGLVNRDDAVRPQIYRAAYTQARTQQRMLSDLLQRAYGGSIKSLVLHAIGGQRVSPDDLRTIEHLLDKMERKR